MELDTLKTVMQGKEWLEYLKTQYIECDVKIFHPDFSTSILSHLNVGLGFLLLFMLLVRYTFPLAPGREALRNICGQANALHLWTSFAVWLFTIQEGGSSLDMGLNFGLFICHSKLIRSADEVLERHLKMLAYRKTMDDAVVLYGINEAHCRDVVTEEPMLRSMLTMIDTNLNHKGIQGAADRHEQGNLLFDGLLGRERLHRQLLNAPHINDTLLTWLNK